MSSSQTPHAAAPGGHGHAPSAGGLALVIGAIGVVFGDIGTSPLYTLKEAFSPHYGLNSDHDTVLGVLSLAFWALNLVVTLKYVTIIMRADNDGEGGIMALMALTQRTLRNGSRSAYVVGILGIFGASLFFGDGVITPAMSVLSAVEGLEVAAPGLHVFIVPVTLVVLLAVFAAQRFGTEKIGKAFGPIMVIWFLSLAAIGVYNIVDAPEVLKAFNPWWGIRFFMEHGWHGIFILGAVVLAVTGGEALYADMGHFGLRPIRHAWYFFVLPCLVLNYLGQGALVLNHPEALKNPFFEAVPSWALYPMIILATMAAVIASQSVITGAFSVSRQAMQLGYIPRMRIKHTSHEPGRGLWHLGVGHHADRHPAAGRGGAHLVAEVAWLAVAAVCGVLHHRPRLRHRQRRQAAAGRLVPGGAGHLPVHHDAYLAPWPRAAAR